MNTMLKVQSEVGEVIFAIENVSTVRRGPILGDFLDEKSAKGLSICMIGGNRFFILEEAEVERVFKIFEAFLSTSV